MIKLGFCPTMKELAEKIAENHEDFIIEAQGSAAEAIQKLNIGILDIIIIGRLAKKSEIDKVNEKIMGEGYTLVTKGKKFIDKENLDKIKVHTSLPKDLVKELLPNTEVIFHNSKEEAVNKGLNDDSVLIDWKDFKDEYDLYVVLDGNIKAKEFRIPVLYSRDYDLNEIKHLNLQNTYWYKE